MTAKEIFTEMKASCKANTENVSYIYYIEYTTKNKLTAVEKMVQKFESDSDIDFELGVITQEEHIKEMAMVKAMTKSIRYAKERVA